MIVFCYVVVVVVVVVIILNVILLVFASIYSISHFVIISM